ncbi:PadR family transcriptional regulator [Mycobacterium sp. MYCO198283]|uniref:PadR family transcriptional regulator n=1 Tax=Mycobacterium sp. MYCO198283 TaxID=2883505 RepID=UPI001E621AFA|nr:PadR family transcriptional regulator [Mycobacterium sp. MYCO198283]MCG5432846.1 PadR family transcriptional regulator [Mycobacterium sp. MYCO198283]
MNFPFDPTAHPGFAPHSRRDARREQRSRLRDELREQAADRGGRFGPGGFGFGPGGPSFGPGGPGFGPGGFGPGGFGFGPGGRRGHHPRRNRRGDVRTAILVLLAERPMHGYEMIQQIAERTDGLWKPSPGSVYPTLQLLVDEGLISAADADGSKRLFQLTDDGRAAAEKVETPPWDQITEDADPAHKDLRTAIGQLMGAVGQSGFAATPEQQQRIIAVITNARREIYQILGD